MVRFFLIVLLLAFSVNAYSQQQIEGFWNVKLGDSRSLVVSNVKKIYPSASYGTGRYDKNDFIVNNPTIAGIDLKKCSFQFTNGKFTSATLSTSYLSDFMSDSGQAQEFINNYQTYVINIFNRLVIAFKQKYGMPQYSSNNEILWSSSNGNSIGISWNNRIEYVPYTGYLSSIGVYVEYKKGSHVNDF